MAESEEAQEVPSRKKYPRAQQDGEAGTAHSAEADSAAYEPRNGGLHSLCGAEWPGTLTGTRGSDSAGVALQGEPDQTQPTSSRNAVHDRSARHERLDVHLQRSEAAELSRCGTPEEGVQAYEGLHCSLAHGYAVPFPDSSTIGMSPRRSKPPIQSAESNHSDDSNANPGDFQGTESPPWSPRRVPPAHVWGEGPPRQPGYRSGGAILPGVPEGVTAADLLGAACELQALLSHRAALGLGPLLHAQPYFPTDSAPGDERHLGHTVPFSGPATPVLQAAPMHEPPTQCSRTRSAVPQDVLCAEGAVLSPVPMQLPAGGSFPTPCMWDMANVHVTEPFLAAGVGPCAEEVDSSHVALFGHQEAGGLNIPTTTADTMGISPALPCKNVLQPKQAHGPEGGPTTPANAEKDKADGGKRHAEDIATSEQPAGAPRKPRRATKRRLF